MTNKADSEYRNRPKQRGALHIWCRMVAEVLNDAGLDMKKVMKPHVDIPWTGYSVKEHLYKTVLESLTGKESTEEQHTTEPDLIAKIITRHLGEKFRVELPPWPDRFNR